MLIRSTNTITDKQFALDGNLTAATSMLLWKRLQALGHWLTLESSGYYFLD